MCCKVIFSWKVSIYTYFSIIPSGIRSFQQFIFHLMVGSSIARRICVHSRGHHLSLLIWDYHWPSDNPFIMVHETAMPMTGLSHIPALSSPYHLLKMAAASTTTFISVNYHREFQYSSLNRRALPNIWSMEYARLLLFHPWVGSQRRWM